MKNTMRQSVILTGIFGVCLMLLAARSMGQCSGSSGDCVENGPYYSLAEVGYCPFIITSASLSATQSCGIKGDAPTDTINPPTYGAGLELYDIYCDCSYPNPDISYWPVNWTANCYWDPPLPAKLDTDFTSTAKYTLTSSDPDNCPAPSGVATIGSCTWKVADNSKTTTAFTQDFSALVNSLENGLNAIPCGVTWQASALSVTGSKTVSQTCCDDASIATKTVKKATWSAQISGTATSPSVSVPYTMGLIQMNVSLTGTINGACTIDQTTTTCPNSAGHWCFSPTITASLTGSLNAIAGSNVATVSIAITGGGQLKTGSWCYYNLTDIEDVADEKPFSVCYNDVVVTGSFKLFTGSTWSVSWTWLTGNC